MTLLLVVAVLPWVLSLLLGFGAEHVDRRLNPSTAVVLLPILSMVTAFAVAASLAALAAVLLASAQVVWVSLGIVICAWMFWRSVEVARHVRRALVGASIASEFGDEARATGGIVVVDSDVPDAFAVPSGGGAVVITTGLAEALSDNELHAVIEHERAHLRHRHSVWIQMCEIAALIDPILGPLTAKVRHAAERQADESAAALGRRDALSAIARTALLRSHLDQGTHTLASTGGDVVRRVQALSEPPRHHPDRGILAAGMVLVLAFTVISAALFDVVQDVVAPETGEVATSIFR
ncbi:MULTISPECIES: M56 family metallopeptidase [Nocardiaceae]|uniref:M56 family metallopeptidase n=1 Tax=Nocardiaceae TaxID=85025 RepID=UPI00050C4F87|nr:MULTISPECIES: M56 family metallopeptidase [Rhodococcus]MDJ0409431.1 M56 family metallopeptidase [Rhodococcus fascians]MDQ0280166.1 Zn-dependent protease with chaperone function [Rhodococcus fascians]OZD06137.1 peptidase M48, Ste24p [Rhodococcus sp. 06-221-2]OZE28061.1 peptidase M48, Ste24p [Rhodococcus sp. 05-2254-5]OZE52424.1 peptidase M48, Ste24p [Rhodococcus sp. 05-2254-1]